MLSKFDKNNNESNLTYGSLLIVINLLFASLNQFDIELHSYYIYEQKSLLTKDGSAKLDYIIIKERKRHIF